jgi:phage head maturation protease
VNNNLQVDYFFTPDGGYEVVSRPISGALSEYAAQSDVRVIVRHDTSVEQVKSALTLLLADIADNGLQMIYQRSAGLVPTAANEEAFG